MMVYDVYLSLKNLLVFTDVEEEVLTSVLKSFTSRHTRLYKNEGVLLPHG
jgi:hypothetical protein